VTCASLAMFCDGALDTPETYAFRDHLRNCNPCQARVLRHVRQCARLAKFGPIIETGPVLLSEETT
jgi:anti-sigma factor RsiW